MFRKPIMAAAMAAVIVPSFAPVEAFAQSRSKHHVYHGKKHYYHRCKRSKGTTGTIAGGAGGALVASALGAGTVGTIAGAAGGALLGRHLDKKHDQAQNRKNGC